MYYPHYTVEDKPTDEQIEKHVGDFMKQYLTIEDIYKYKLDEGKSLEERQAKSNEELDEIIKQYLLTKQA